VHDELLPNGVLHSYEVFRGSLRLDGQTIANLELLENRDDGGRAGQITVIYYGGIRFVMHSPAQEESSLNSWEICGNRTHIFLS
jgi:hypothetical protein